MVNITVCLLFPVYWKTCLGRMNAVFDQTVFLYPDELTAKSRFSSLKLYIYIYIERDLSIYIYIIYIYSKLRKFYHS